MRRAALLVFFVALLACGDDEPDPPDPPIDPPRPAIHWVRTVLFERLDLAIPKAWSHDYRPFGPDQVHFSAPKDDDFRPQLQVLWRRRDSTPAAWAEHMTGKFTNNPLVTVFGRGRQSVAGMSGYYLTYGQTAKHPGTGKTLEFRTIDFYFAGYGHVGMVRGVSTARTFFDYRPLFTEIARRLKYRR